jgi:hypothetical protein
MYGDDENLMKVIETLHGSSPSPEPFVVEEMIKFFDWVSPKRLPIISNNENDNDKVADSAA